MIVGSVPRYGRNTHTCAPGTAVGAGFPVPRGSSKTSDRSASASADAQAPAESRMRHLQLTTASIYCPKHTRKEPVPARLGLLMMPASLCPEAEVVRTSDQPVGDASAAAHAHA